MKTLKQRWAFKRCFQHKGSLSGIISRLHQIASERSTLPHEERSLLHAADIVSDILKSWDNYPDHSWRTFEMRIKNDLY